MFNQTIIPESNTTYLGIKVDNKINFNLHTAMTKKNVICRAKHFRSLTYHNKGCDINTLTKIYKLICRPLIEYAGILFVNLKNPAQRNLQVAESSCLRILTKLRHPNNPVHNPPNAFLYEYTHIQPILERRLRLVEKFAEKETNIDLLRLYCLQRNQLADVHYKHPEKTLWERISQDYN